MNKFIRLNEKLYNTRSFRLGRATVLASFGTPDHIITARWRSNAYFNLVCFSPDVLSSLFSLLSLSSSLLWAEVILLMTFWALLPCDIVLRFRRLLGGVRNCFIKINILCLFTTRHFLYYLLSVIFNLCASLVQVVGTYPWGWQDLGVLHKLSRFMEVSLVLSTLGDL